MLHTFVAFCSVRTLIFMIVHVVYHGSGTFLSTLVHELFCCVGLELCGVMLVTISIRVDDLMDYPATLIKWPPW